jgi:hypothetical protein
MYYYMGDVVQPQLNNPDNTLPYPQALGDAGGVLMVGGMVLLGVAFVGLIGWSIYKQQQVVSGIAKREGSRKALEYQAGTAAIGFLSQLGSRSMHGR